MFNRAGNDGWEELGMTRGGKTEVIDRMKVLEKENILMPEKKSDPLEGVFDALTIQWASYDILSVMTNVINPGHDQEASRAETNERAQGILKIKTDCTSRHWGGPEIHAVPRFLGAGGIYMYTPGFTMADSGEMEVVVDSIVNEMPVLFPGVSIHPGERAVALFGSGSRNILLPFAEQVKTGLQPLRWCACLGGDMNAGSASAFFLISMTGPELQKLFGKEHPPASVIRWRKRAEELWERAVRAK
jgi:hypothetical protein